MARQENTVAGEEHRREHLQSRFTSVCPLNPAPQHWSSNRLWLTEESFRWWWWRWNLFTCEVADRLQFERLQDGFERGHLQVHLLVDLHVVVFQVGFLVMSSPKQTPKTTNQRRVYSQVYFSSIYYSVHLPSDETLWWPPSASSPVQWTERTTKWAPDTAGTNITSLRAFKLIQASISRDLT